MYWRNMMDVPGLMVTSVSEITSFLVSLDLSYNIKYLTDLLSIVVDSDTEVPEDCLLDAVSEMEQNPEVAILQFASGVMQVVHTYFENGM